MVRLDTQVLEREKVLEVVGNDIDFIFHSTNKGKPVKFVKQKKTRIILNSININIMLGFEGEGVRRLARTFYFLLNERQ